MSWVQSSCVQLATAANVSELPRRAQTSIISNTRRAAPVQSASERLVLPCVRVHLHRQVTRSPLKRQAPPLLSSTGKIPLFSAKVSRKIGDVSFVGAIPPSSWLYDRGNFLGMLSYAYGVSASRALSANGSYWPQCVTWFGAAIRVGER